VQAWLFVASLGGASGNIDDAFLFIFFICNNHSFFEALLRPSAVYQSAAPLFSATK
jgi:hypothetical protein